MHIRQQGSESRCHCIRHRVHLCSYLLLGNLVHTWLYFKKTRIDIRLNVAHLCYHLRAFYSLYITTRLAKKFRTQWQSGVFVDVYERFRVDFACRCLRLSSFCIAILQSCSSSLLFFADEFNATKPVQVTYQLAGRHQLMKLKAGGLGGQLCRWRTRWSES